MNGHRTAIRTTTLLTLAALAGCQPPAADRRAEEAAPPGGPPEPVAAAAAPGRIAGTAAIARVPRRPPIDMESDKRCQDLHDEPVRARDVVADDDGRLANAFVYLKEGVPPGEYEPPDEDGLLDQIGCLFVPRVQGVRAGQRLVVRNSDPTLHNVQAQPRGNPSFNFGQPFQGMEKVLVFERSEVMIRVRCDVHSWMASFLGVLEHPFWAVSAADGTWALEDVPPGDYLVEAWHEVFEPRQRRVTVASDGTVQIDFRWGSEAAK